jgi:hypothetical protein
MNKLIFSVLIAAFLISCKNKEKLDSTKAFFSVVDYLQAQVKHMDSLPLIYKKIETIDSTSDTSKISREEFKKYATEFLTVPDIASPSKMDEYTETNDFDEILNNVLLMYTAKKPDATVQSETIMMEPDDLGNTQVKTILVNVSAMEGDSSIEKNMTWHIDKRFQIVTKSTRQGQPEKIKTVVVSWE